MGLYTKQICPIRARKDIVCYKVLIENPLFPSPYRTLFRNRLCNIGDKLIGQPLCVKSGKRQLQLNRFGSYAYIIGGGFVHAYVTKEIAHIVVLQERSEKRIIVKCIIPKGTLYYINITKTEICAKEMILEEIVK